MDTNTKTNEDGKPDTKIEKDEVVKVEKAEDKALKEE